VDGSDNFFRGLPLSSISLAVLASKSELCVDQVQFSMVGSLASSVPILASTNKGAWQGDTRLRVSPVSEVKNAFISCEMNHAFVDSHLGKLLKDARGVRSYGCASQAITLVAQGALDVHIDIRSRLTPESFLAAAHILQEAGGSLFIEGEKKIASSLADRFNLIVASTPELLCEVKQRLFGDITP